MSDKILDRYIPLKTHGTLSQDLFDLNVEIPKLKKRDRETYETATFTRLFGNNVPRILNFSDQPQETTSLVLNKNYVTRNIQPRKIPPISHKFDVPSISNDFYSHALSSKNDLLGFITDDQITLTNFTGKKRSFKELDSLRCLHISSYANELFCGRVNYSYDLASGNKGIVSRYDLNLIRQTSMSIENDLPLVISQFKEMSICVGTEKGDIIISDMRCPKVDNRLPVISEIDNAHSDRICKLVINGDLLASGGNDDRLRIWDIRRAQSPIRTFEFKGAVRAIAWHGDNLLVGAGNKDRTLNYFRMNRNEPIDSIDTGSQILNLHCSNNRTNEFVTTHGYGINRDDPSSKIQLWKITSDMKILSLDKTNPNSLEGRAIHSCLIDIQGSPSLCTADCFGEKINIRKGIFETKPEIPLEQTLEQTFEERLQKRTQIR